MGGNLRSVDICWVIETGSEIWVGIYLDTFVGTLFLGNVQVLPHQVKCRVGVSDLTC